jgi:hypothetical protein
MPPRKLKFLSSCLKIWTIFSAHGDWVWGQSLESILDGQPENFILGFIHFSNLLQSVLHLIWYGLYDWTVRRWDRETDFRLY